MPTLLVTATINLKTISEKEVEMRQQHQNNSFPRLRILPPSHACKVLFSCLKGQNSPIKPGATEEQTDDIERKQAPALKSGSISYLQRGNPEGRRVIFIHGTPGSARGWADYLLGARSGCLYIALDRPGYGFSEPRHAVTSLRQQAQALVSLVDSSNHRKTVLVGHSSGAPVALQAALDFPDDIGGLLLLAGAFDPDLEEANWLQPLGLLKPVSWLLPRIINNANRELLGLKRQLQEQAGTLHRINIPVNIVHGARDPLVPIANLDYLKHKLVSTSLDVKVLKHSDHFIPWNSKPVIDESLKRLISRVSEGE